MTRTLFIAAASLSLAASWGCAPKQAQAEGKAPPPAKEKADLNAGSRLRVEVASLAPSEAVLAFTFPGEVEGSRDALLAAPLGGYVEAVLVREGDRVKKGQALLRVDTAIYAARRDQAQAEFEAAQREADRLKAMGDAVARAQRDAAQTRLKISEAGLTLAQTQLSRSIVTAPFDGVIAQLAPEVGEVTAPGAPVGRLVQLDPVKVTLAVADRDIAALSVGLPVAITTDALREVMPGKVRFVSPAADLRTRAFRAEIEAANGDGRLLPGMIARVKVDAQRARDSVVIPQDVVVTRMQEVGVYVPEDGAAKWRPLKLGPVVGQQVVVESGLSLGDKVVVNGHRDLVDGDLLDVAREGTCCSRGRVVWADEGTAR